VGQADKIECFFCGCLVQDWKPRDEPWTEHAKRSPHCSFVRLHKGDAFVQDVTSYESVHGGDVST
ncbi:hypothetical protein CAPTEDRAFT_139403, partial [Capitella teleta]